MSYYSALAIEWYENFNRYAGDLYPGLYTFEHCLELAEKAAEINWLAQAKDSHKLVHYYLRPEFHEIATKLGDSLALSRYAEEAKARRVDFLAVAFMGDTAKIITGNKTRVYMSDSSQNLGCSLVFGTDYDWIERWKKQNPDGITVSYINSSLYLKSISDFICTSRNTDKIIAYAVKTYPGRKILVLPDKYLGMVMRARALQLLENEGIAVDPNLIEVYNHPFGGFNACCYIHEQFGPDAIEIAMMENPDAELLIHPECGCASTCMFKVQQGIIPHEKAYFLSTEQMIHRAKESGSKKFIVATEPGHLYALRKLVPNKVFMPISTTAHCKYMKSNDFDKLLVTLKEDRIERVICEDCDKCTDPKHPYEDESVSHLPFLQVEAARKGIERMLTIS